MLVCVCDIETTFLFLDASVMNASLYESLSVCPSVRPSVCPSVGPSFRRSVGPSVRWSVVSELESVKTRISAPAHPSATGIGRVSGLVDVESK